MMRGTRGRGRGRGVAPAQDSFRGFQEASKEIQENLARHLVKSQEQENISDSDSDVDSEGADELVDRVLDSYKGSSVEPGFLQEAKALLRNAIQSSVCYISSFISLTRKKRKKRGERQRQNGEVVFLSLGLLDLHLFGQENRSNMELWHLLRLLSHNMYSKVTTPTITIITDYYINRWAKDTIFQQKQQLEGDPDRTEKEKKICWSCPKCRNESPAIFIPKEYRCYCGRERDPAFDPWQTPHSCGERCNRQLSGCTHKCALLCHPGPCPPCPQTVQQACHCGQSSPVTRRCSAAAWSCGQECGGRLGCGAHFCPATCHPGECAPCERTSVQSCECKKTKEPRQCSAPQFKCGHPCGALLSCGFHNCDHICHPPGPCPPCPLSLDRHCPCGKSVVRLPCTEATPTCGDTCGKTLGCGSHTCAERCHRGSCPSCLQMKVKKCRCGARQKEVQCAKTFTCEAKCRLMRDCQRHQCNRKCCVGDCPPCEQMCGKTLNCKNHKCLSRCHRGACYPCQLEVEVRCACGATKAKVPCGREKVTRPPRCRKPCSAPSNCHHEQRAPHPCHSGKSSKLFNH